MTTKQRFYSELIGIAEQYCEGKIISKSNSIKSRYNQPIFCFDIISINDDGDKFKNYIELSHTGQVLNWDKIYISNETD